MDGNLGTTTLATRLAAHRLVLSDLAARVDALGEARLGVPTPCTRWDLGDLVVHLANQNVGFTAALTGDGTDLGQWNSFTDPVRALAGFHRTCDDVATAFELVDPARPVCLPEISPTLTFTAQRVLGFHTLDCAVHAWDVAESLGEPYDVPPAALAHVLEAAFAVPEERAPADRALFGPVVGAATHADDWSRALAWLGRRPLSRG